MESLPWPWAEYNLSLEALHCSHAVLRALPLGLQGSAPVLELPLPGIDASRVRVHSDDQVCHAGAESRALPEEDWRLLEAPLLAGTLPACRLPGRAGYVTTETPGLSGASCVVSGGGDELCLGRQGGWLSSWAMLYHVESV